MRLWVFVRVSGSESKPKERGRWKEALAEVRAVQQGSVPALGTRFQSQDVSLCTWQLACGCDPHGEAGCNQEVKHHCALV